MHRAWASTAQALRSHTSSAARSIVPAVTSAPARHAGQYRLSEVASEWDSATAAHKTTRSAAFAPSREAAAAVARARAGGNKSAARRAARGAAAVGAWGEGERAAADGGYIEFARDDANEADEGWLDDEEEEEFDHAVDTFEDDFSSQRTAPSSSSSEAKGLADASRALRSLATAGAAVPAASLFLESFDCLPGLTAQLGDLPKALKEHSASLPPAARAFLPHSAPTTGATGHSEGSAQGPGELTPRAAAIAAAERRPEWMPPRFPDIIAVNTLVKALCGEAARSLPPAFPTIRVPARALPSAPAAAAAAAATAPSPGMEAASADAVAGLPEAAAFAGPAGAGAGRRVHLHPCVIAALDALDYSFFISQNPTPLLKHALHAREAAVLAALPSASPAYVAAATAAASGRGGALSERAARKGRFAKIFTDEADAAAAQEEWWTGKASSSSVSPQESELAEGSASLAPSLSENELAAEFTVAFEPETISSLSSAIAAATPRPTLGSLAPLAALAAAAGDRVLGQAILARLHLWGLGPDLAADADGMSSGNSAAAAVLESCLPRALAGDAALTPAQATVFSLLWAQLSHKGQSAASKGGEWPTWVWPRPTSSAARARIFANLPTSALSSPPELPPTVTITHDDSGPRVRWPASSPVVLPARQFDAALAAAAAAPGWGAGFATNFAVKTLAKVEADAVAAARTSDKRSDKGSDKPVTSDVFGDLLIPDLPPPEILSAAVSEADLSSLTTAAAAAAAASGNTSSEPAVTAAAAAAAAADAAMARARAVHARVLAAGHAARAAAAERALVCAVAWTGAARARLIRAAAGDALPPPSSSSLSLLLRLATALQSHVIGLATAHAPRTPLSWAGPALTMRARADAALAAVGAQWGLVTARPHFLAPQRESAVSPISLPLSLHKSVEAKLAPAPRLRLVFPPPASLTAPLARTPLPPAAFALPGVPLKLAATRTGAAAVGAVPQVVVSLGSAAAAAAGSGVIAAESGDSPVFEAASAALATSPALMHAVSHPQDLVLVQEPLEHKAAALLRAARVDYSPAFSHTEEAGGLPLWAASPSPFLFRAVTDPAAAAAEGTAVAETVAAAEAAAPAPGLPPLPAPGLGNALVSTIPALDLVAAMPTGSVDRLLALAPPPPAVSAAAEEAAVDAETRRKHDIGGGFSSGASSQGGGKKGKNKGKGDDDVPKTVKIKKNGKFIRVPIEEAEAAAKKKGNKPSDSTEAKGGPLSARKRAAFARDSLLSEPLLWAAARALRPKTGAFVIASQDPRVWAWVEVMLPEHASPASASAAAAAAAAVEDSEDGAGESEENAEDKAQRLLKALGREPKLDDLLTAEEVDPRAPVRECPALAPLQAAAAEASLMGAAGGKRALPLRAWVVRRSAWPWV